MSRSVLLVDSDVEALGHLASGLRARGLVVILADGIHGALDRSRSVQLDAILVAESVLNLPPAHDHFLQDPILGALPRFTLVDSSDSSPSSTNLCRHDPELIARRILTLQNRVMPLAAERGDFRGDLRDVALPDLLQLLGMNRRTGALTIATTNGSGEIRLLVGEVVDAVFRRVEGTKALYRLLREDTGTFSFSNGTQTPLRRIAQSSHLLVLEGLRHLDEVRRLLSTLGATDDALQSTSPAPPTTDSSLAAAILMALQAPHTTTELLDLLPQPDLDILVVLTDLLSQQLVRRIEHGALRAELADTERLSVLSAVLAQRRPPGFLSNTRLVFLGSPRSLAAAQTALGRIAESIADGDGNALTPFTRRLATLRLGDGVELDVVGLPDLESFAPLWGLTLAGSSAVILLPNATSSAILKDTCSLLGVPLLEAQALVGTMDEGDPRQIASLVRSALESVAVC